MLQAISRANDFKREFRKKQTDRLNHGRSITDLPRKLFAFFDEIVDALGDFLLLQEALRLKLGDEGLEGDAAFLEIPRSSHLLHQTRKLRFDHVHLRVEGQRYD